MTEIADAARLATALLSGGDPALWRAVALSLGVSAAATAIAAVPGVPAGAALAALSFPGRRALVVLAYALLGLPPVVVGLALHPFLARAGLLSTRAALVIAQALLVLPVATALTHRAAAPARRKYGQVLRACGAGPLRTVPHLLRLSRARVLAALVVGFARAVSEAGADLILGAGAGRTRTLASAIVLETGQGHLAPALALGLVLAVIGPVSAVAAFALWRAGDRSEDDRCDEGRLGGGRLDTDVQPWRLTRSREPI